MSFLKSFLPSSSVVRPRTAAHVASFLARRAEYADRTERAITSTTATDARRLMTRDDAVALAQFVREVLNRPTYNVHLEHRVTAAALYTPVAGPRCADADEFWLDWNVKLGDITLYHGQVTVGTDVRDLETLRQVLQHAAPPLPEPPPSADELDDRAALDTLVRPHTYTYLPITTWHPNTAAAAETERGAMLGRLLAPLHGTAWQGAGTVAVSQRGFYAINHDMHVAQWGEATDSEISLTVHSMDGMTSGWSGQAHRDWRRLNPERVAQEAIATALQQQNAVRAEPGRYTTILSATAVGQFLQQMAPLFNVLAASPLSIRGQQRGQAKDRRGERLFDPRITLSTDPTDPEGGDFPFFPQGDPYPSGQATWVEQGVLKRRSIDTDNAFLFGLDPIRDPECIRMSNASSEGPTSVAEMIAQCERGVYVHRLASINLVDGWSGTMEGFTRDGCLWIEQGKIKHPVKDFRFYESPFLAFNRVIALGTPQRIAFGFTPRLQDDPAHRWPYAPVIAPPLMVRDFNFSALADNA